MDLHGIELAFTASAAALRQAWAALFAGWRPAGRRAGAGRIELEFRLGEALPAPPARQPLLQAAAGQTIFAGQVDGDFEIWFPGLAWLTVSTGRSQLNGTILPAALAQGQWQRLLFAGLAPILRRRQLFLLHGFGVQRRDVTRLLLGPIGAGKSAAGVAHLLAGWHYLGNDLLLLAAQPDGVYAWPTPGELAIRPDTVTRMPAVAPWLLSRETAPDLQLGLDVGRVWREQGGAPGRVTELCFVQQQAEPSSLRPIRPVQALGQLMTHSIDRWDSALFAEHAAVLRLLVEGADCVTYGLGPELGVVGS